MEQISLPSLLIFIKDYFISSCKLGINHGFVAKIVNRSAPQGSWQGLSAPFQLKIRSEDLVQFLTNEGELDGHNCHLWQDLLYIKYIAELFSFKGGKIQNVFSCIVCLCRFLGCKAVWQN